MTRFEWLYTCVRRLDHPLYQHVHRQLSSLESSAPVRVLDVGGRRSNYTIGLQSPITISDIPPAGALQQQLDLGATDATRQRVLSRRSNVQDYVIDDMTATQLPPSSYDVVVAVEVLEHVEQDAAFVQNVFRVLAPGGVFVMTTPNGDFLPTPYPDHKRHYQRAQLQQLLSASFPTVTVDYIVNAGRLITAGVHQLSVNTPLRSLMSPVALSLAYHTEWMGMGGSGPMGKRHLLAVAKKPKDRAQTC